MSQLAIYLSLAESIATLFAPMVEVVLLGAGEQLHGVFNRLTTDELPQNSAHQPIKIFINKSQQAKLIYIPLENDFTLRIIADTSLFDSLQLLLQKYLATENSKENINNWQHSVDKVITDYLEQHNTTLIALSPQEKRTLILSLHDKDFFRYQDATRYLACKLNVSRATIYNYLKQASELKSIEIHQVDAFTDEPFSGNPAGVVLDADALSDVMMKKITREMNLSETSFLLKSEVADIRLRYFTPNGSEVKFCGHSTVGALYMLAHQKRFNLTQPGHYEFKLETQIGILPVVLTLEDDYSITIQFETPEIDLNDSTITHQELATALGVEIDMIDTNKPIMFEKNNRDLYVVIKNLATLEKVNIDQKSAKLFAEKHDIVAFALLSNETISPNSHIHMRCFAPLVGIPEDPFTGSVLGGLASYIRKHNLIATDLDTVRIEQGHFISRPGFVDLKLVGEGQSPLVLAKARHFFSTKIEL